MSWGRWRARSPVGWSHEPGAGLERERHSEKEVDHSSHFVGQGLAFPERDKMLQVAASKQYP